MRKKNQIHLKRLYSSYTSLDDLIPQNSFLFLPKTLLKKSENKLHQNNLCSKNN